MPPLPCRLLGCVVLLVLVGCQRSDPGSSPSATPAGPVPVTLTTPTRKTLTGTVEQPGSVQPFEFAPIEARVAGYLKRVPVDIGDAVRAGPSGTILAELDVPDLIQEAARKRAGVESAKAQAEEARQAVAVAEAQAKVAAAGVRETEALVLKAQADVERWESELERVEKLAAAGGSVDRQTRDETKRQMEAARATRQAAEARVEAARGSVTEAEAKKRAAQATVAAAEALVRVAEADVKRAEVDLEFATLRPPFDGVVTARNVHPGHFVKPGSGSLFTVARLDVVRVTLDVPEVAASQATPGAKVEVIVPALGNRSFPGTVARSAQVLNPEARTMRVEIDLKNPDKLLRPGLYVTVRLSTSTPDAFVVPAAAVLVADETAYCYAIEDGKAVKLQVRTGRSDAGGVQLLAKRKAGVATAEWQPITGEERIAVGQLGALSDGQPVAVP